MLIQTFVHLAQWDKYFLHMVKKLVNALTLLYDKCYIMHQHMVDNFFCLDVGHNVR